MHNSLSNDLIRLRCSTCDGENFGCRGCTEDKKIEEVLEKYNVLELKESQINYDDVLNTKKSAR